MILIEKILIKKFLDVSKILGQLNLFHRLVLGIRKDSNVFTSLNNFFTMKIFLHFS